MENKSLFCSFRIILFAGAIGWACPVIFLVLPSDMIFSILTSKGLSTRVSDPMIIYCFFMAVASWGLIGFIFGIVGLFPLRYFNIIPLLAIGSIFQGVVLLSTGVILKINIGFFLWDTLFCLFLGGAMLLMHRKITNFYFTKHN